MIRHVVWFTMKQEAEGATGKENARKIVEQLNSLSGRVPGLDSIEASTDFAATTTEEVGCLLLASCKDTDALAQYDAHPLHQEVVSFIKKVIASRKAIDYVI